MGEPRRVGSLGGHGTAVGGCGGRILPYGLVKGARAGRNPTAGDDLGFLLRGRGSLSSPGELTVCSWPQLTLKSFPSDSRVREHSLVQCGTRNLTQRRSTWQFAAACPRVQSAEILTKLAPLRKKIEGGFAFGRCGGFGTRHLEGSAGRHLRGAPASPPSRRQREFPRATERFLKLEKGQLELQHSNASDSNNVVTVVLVEKPTEEDSTIIAVGDTSAAHHVNMDDVCMAHIRVEDLEEPQTSTFFENVYDKSSYDLGNFTNKILSDNEKRQILDMGPLQPSGPFSNRHQPE
ncbi:hypothetical protein EVAR_77162_1 [Eumeta japonica]|uniref:Uncharacterized protein n=1 Tax=Eumeta variegata TaxID=151549 RepID=A0A4C1T4H7_EUMVA|nr:hypothetical protein EVAR_77162_1 [Eumeta japonica]